MSEIVKAGAILEGAKCEIYTRKEVLKGLRKDPITSKAMLKYELSRNCSVEITKELELATQEERDLRISLHVYGKLGDKIKADSVSLYIDQKLPVKIEVKEGATHTHGGHFFSTKKRTIGVIKYQFPNLPDLLNDMKQNKLIEQK